MSEGEVLRSVWQLSNLLPLKHEPSLNSCRSGTFFLHLVFLYFVFVFVFFNCNLYNRSPLSILVNLEQVCFHFLPKNLTVLCGQEGNLVRTSEAVDIKRVSKLPNSAIVLICHIISIWWTNYMLSILSVICCQMLSLSLQVIMKIKKINLLTSNGFQNCPTPRLSSFFI